MSTVSPRPADPRVRTALIEAAARLLADHEALTIRRLAAEVGTSTMAVYTHFGSMDDLRHEVRREGFARLAAHMAGVSPTNDPVADISALGWAYVANGLVNPNLYRVMFLEAAVDVDEHAVGDATFLPVVAATERCIEAGRFDDRDALSMAIQLWTTTHAMVTIVLAELLSIPDMTGHLIALAENLYVGFGDDRAAARRSLAKARRRMESVVGYPGTT